MKRFYALAVLLSALPVMAVTVTNYITDTLGNPLKARVVITPYTPSTVFGSTNVQGLSVGTPCTNGQWAASLVGGWYLVDQGNGSPKIPIFGAAGDTQTNNLAFFASLATNPIPTFGYTGTNVGDTVIVTNLYVTNLYVRNITYTLGGSNLVFATTGTVLTGQSGTATLTLGTNATSNIKILSVGKGTEVFDFQEGWISVTNGAVSDYSQPPLVHTGTGYSFNQFTATGTGGSIVLSFPNASGVSVTFNVSAWIISVN